MSDFAWIAFIIIVYIVVIKPLMQGVLQTPKKAGGPGNGSQVKQQEKGDADYVDYEEIK